MWLLKSTFFGFTLPNLTVAMGYVSAAMADEARVVERLG
jgi:hypothetical protein